MEQDEAQYSDAVLQAVAAGRKIEAIKRLREETGLGLKEAKAAIDRLAHQHQPAGTGMSEQGGAGALIKLIVAIVVVFVAYRFLVGG